MVIPIPVDIWQNLCYTVGIIRKQVDCTRIRRDLLGVDVEGASPVLSGGKIKKILPKTATHFGLSYPQVIHSRQSYPQLVHTLWISPKLSTINSRLIHKSNSLAIWIGFTRFAAAVDLPLYVIGVGFLHSLYTKWLWHRFISVYTLIISRTMLTIRTHTVTHIHLIIHHSLNTKARTTSTSC